LNLDLARRLNSSRFNNFHLFPRLNESFSNKPLQKPFSNPLNIGYVLQWHLSHQKTLQSNLKRKPLFILGIPKQSSTTRWINSPSNGYYLPTILHIQSMQGVRLERRELDWCRKLWSLFVCLWFLKIRVQSLFDLKKYLGLEFSKFAIYKENKTKWHLGNF
jgi:hypothetical protein